jgi:uncharacterized protein (DUF2252 family)
MQVQPYGMILDILEGLDPQSGKPYVLMRAIQVIRRNNGSNGLATRRYVILAEPSDGFSTASSNGDDLKIVSTKQYYIHVPSYEDMVAQASNDSTISTSLRHISS